MSEFISFAEEIVANKNAVEVSSEVAGIETMSSSLDVRLRGGYITECQLTSPTTGERLDVLYSEPNLQKPKITATHAMVPAGPYDGLGGQHGFPRWSDYHEFSIADRPNGEKQISLQAKRSDNGLSLVKMYGLTASTLTTRTTITSSEDKVEHTSMGEHLYFSLADERLDGLKVNGQSLDELVGVGSEDKVKNDDTLYWAFGGEATVDFPAGHSVKLSADFNGVTKHPLAMWIWKRPGSPSICFEPVVGLTDDDNNSGVELAPYANATLTTKIDLL